MSKIPIGFPTEGEPIAIDKIMIEYMQEPDSNADEMQTLEIITDDAGAGKYFVIKTERWAFDTKEELMRVIDDFIERMAIT